MAFADLTHNQEPGLRGIATASEYPEVLCHLVKDIISQHGYDSSLKLAINMIYMHSFLALLHARPCNPKLVELDHHPNSRRPSRTDLSTTQPINAERIPNNYFRRI